MTAQMTATGFAVDASGNVTATSFVGPVTGNAATATLAANATNLTDKLVTATIALAAGSGNNKPLTLTLTRSDGSTAVASARTVLIRTCASSAFGDPLAATVGTVTFSAATTGAIVVSGNGWAIVTTDATGAFACTCTDSADEEVQFSVATAGGVASAAASCVVMPGAYVAVTWA